MSLSRLALDLSSAAFFLTSYWAWRGANSGVVSACSIRLQVIKDALEGRTCSSDWEQSGRVRPETLPPWPYSRAVLLSA